jgi:hypothetical protein
MTTESSQEVKWRNRRLMSFVLFAGTVTTFLVAAAITYLHDQGEKADRKAAAALEQQQAQRQARFEWARYDSSIKGCQRNNALRRRTSQLGNAVTAVNELLVQFFDSSARFRAKTGQPALAQESIDARETIRKVAESLKPIPQINCYGAIPVPLVPRPLPVNQKPEESS